MLHEAVAHLRLEEVVVESVDIEHATGDFRLRAVSGVCLSYDGGDCRSGKGVFLLHMAHLVAVAEDVRLPVPVNLCACRCPHR